LDCCGIWLRQGRWLRFFVVETNFDFFLVGHHQNQGMNFQGHFCV
jgi:hypothetical protein